MKCQTEVFHNMELNFCLIIIINIGTKSLTKRASPSIHGEYIDDPACIWFWKLLAFTKMQKRQKTLTDSQKSLSVSENTEISVK